MHNWSKNVSVPAFPVQASLIVNWAHFLTNHPALSKHRNYFLHQEFKSVSRLCHDMTQTLTSVKVTKCLGNSFEKCPRLVQKFGVKKHLPHASPIDQYTKVSIDFYLIKWNWTINQRYSDLTSKDQFQTSSSRVTMEVSLKCFEEVLSRRPIISETILGYWVSGDGGEGSHNYKNDRVRSLLLFCKGSKCENLRCKKATIRVILQYYWSIRWKM